MNTKFSPEQLKLQTLIKLNMVAKADLQFSTDLAHNQDSRGLTSKQLYWVNELIKRALNPKVVLLPVSDTVDCDKIFKFFEVAGAHLKTPRIWLQTGSGLEIRFSIMGQTSRTPGYIAISGKGIGQFYGSIGTDKKLFFARKGKAYAVEIEKLIKEFNADPAAVAAAYGKLNNKCCFCSLPLSTPESMGAGYGEICAEHYGLPYGIKTVTKPQVISDYQKVG